MDVRVWASGRGGLLGMCFWEMGSQPLSGHLYLPQLMAAWVSGKVGLTPAAPAAMPTLAGGKSGFISEHESQT